ncbi:MAG: hypothetical protein Q7U77_01815 [Sediminibacterium sp.]|uniref:hypothetical protein n=1 Tax=Sediminibacterium sp. TaxID=1917865 RepID=UPI0027241F01|nr:hypothetical protein [Sediminibacterium sp.]MDO8995340.1 hypothetical protein [Sediminibacterium sp.]
MTMYLWNTDRLSLALANQELTNEQKFQYLLLLQLIYAAAGYLAWLFITPSTENLFWFEGLMVLVLTFYGLRRCRARYAAAPHNRFVEDCMLLQAPLALKFFGFIWLGHYAIRHLFEMLVPLLHAETESTARQIDTFLSLTYNTYPFALVLIATAWFYLRLSHHMEAVANAQRT